MRVAPLFSLTLLAAAAVGASNAQAAFTCTATAAHITVLGQKVAPVVANPGPGDCASDTKTLSGAAMGLPLPLKIGTVVASTEVQSAAKSVTAAGGLADIKLSALPELPIQLPPVVLPDAIKAVRIPLGAVKDVIPVLPDPTNLGLNAARDLIPAEIVVDASAAVNALLPSGKLPNVDLLHIKGAMAYAAGACRNGSPFVASSSSVLGVSVLGTELPVNQLLERTLSLIDTASIDPSQANVAALNLGIPPLAANLITSLPAAQQALVTAIQGALDALPDLKVLDPTVAQVKITPGAEVRNGNSVSRRALQVTVTVAGQPLLDAVIGEASVSAEGVDCAAAVADPSTPTGAALQCSDRNLVLVDVLERRGRVKLFGVADPALAGKTVDIVFNATGRVVARAAVGDDGSFDTTAPLPPRGMRSSNDARYMARLGAERSINLKLRRRMVIDSTSAEGRRVTITGRVLAPFARKMRAITLRRQTSCTDEKTVTQFKPRKNGRFRVTVLAPRGLGTVVYRMTTEVRHSFHGTALFKTFTLPRAVDLKR